MHNMHETNRTQRRPTEQQQQQPQSNQQHEPRRTGPIDEEQQRRIAARAARAMEKQIRRRRDHRSLFMWGDRKKAEIKRFPNGTQVILVPQTLTPEQEHYQFPPRSRLLKSLDHARAERRRMQQPSSSSAIATPTSTTDLAQPHHQHLPPPTVIPSLSPPRPDPQTINEWFSSQRNRDVRAWLAQVEHSEQVENRSSSRNSSHRHRLMASSPAPSSSSSIMSRRHARRRRPLQEHHQPAATAAAAAPLPPPPSYHNEVIHFRSAAGKRWAQDSSPTQHQQKRVPSACAPPLAPPPDNDSIEKHYVPRGLLRYPQQRQDEAAARIQAFWRGRQERKKPIGGMVRLVGMFHQTLERHQRQAKERLAQIEHQLQEERHHREVSQHRLDQLKATQQQSSSSLTNKHASLTERLARLEKSLGQETSRRHDLQTTLSSAIHQMNQLEKSMLQQVDHGRKARHGLQKQLDQVLLDIRTVRSARR